MDFETERVEFKLTGTDEIYKEVIAFANTDGGTIYIGIDDKGNVIGVDQINETYTRLANGIRDEIQPDVTIFIKYAVLENRVIRIAVGEGASKPYYLRKKGLKPSGVFVRQGTSSVQASQDQIRRLIKETDGDNFEAKLFFPLFWGLDRGSSIFMLSSDSLLVQSRAAFPIPEGPSRKRRRVIARLRS